MRKLFHLGGFIAAAIALRSYGGYTYYPEDFATVRIAYMIFSMIFLVFSLFLLVVLMLNIVNVDPFLRVPWYPVVISKSLDLLFSPRVYFNNS